MNGVSIFTGIGILTSKPRCKKPFGQKLFALTDSKELAKMLAAPYDHTSLEYQQKPDGKWLRMDVYLMKRGHNCAHSFVLTFRNVTQERRAGAGAQAGGGQG